MIFVVTNPCTQSATILKGGGCGWDRGIRAAVQHAL